MGLFDAWRNRDAGSTSAPGAAGTGSEPLHGDGPESTAADQAYEPATPSVDHPGLAAWFDGSGAGGDGGGFGGFGGGDAGG